MTDDNIEFTPEYLAEIAVGLSVGDEITVNEGNQLPKLGGTARFFALIL